MLQDTRLRYALPLGLDALAWALSAVLHDGLMAYQATARFTGRVSLCLFVTMGVLYARTSSREHARRLMGPFAAVHLFHFVCLVLYSAQLEEKPAITRLLGGALAYAMIVLMPLFQRVAGDLSERVRVRVESVYFGWVGFIFFMSYVMRLLGKVPEAGGTRMEHLGFLALFVVALLVHVGLRVRKPARD